MSDYSKIEWTDATWNPVRGCSKVSPGCANCYAETFAERFRGVLGHPFENGFDLTLVPEKLGAPFLWPTSKMVFVNSMSDLFHEDISDEYIVEVVRVMTQANWHTYQVLTKRHERLLKMLETKLRFAASCSFIWWGVSVENKKYGIPRITTLQESCALKRFLSIEPLLEDLGRLDLRNIEWVIVGGESGSHARPMKAQWVRNIRRQCKETGVKFFFKQWGGLRKAATGRALDGKTYDEIPLRSTVEVPSRQRRFAMYAELRLRQTEEQRQWNRTSMLAASRP